VSKQCPKCGGGKWEGPKYVRYYNSWLTLPGTWPHTSDNLPHVEGLEFRCSTCGYFDYRKTVACGGDPVTTTTATPKRVTDTGGTVMNDD
jgi:hypothetical protein